MLDIGIIIPRLEQYGGAERLLIECLSRWQHLHRLTLYATRWNDVLLREHGVEDRVRRVRLTSAAEGPHAMLFNGTVLPKIWEQELGRHDVYHAHQWPTHLIDRHPLVWYPHEPWRCLHDLRYDLPVNGLAQALSQNLGHFSRQTRLADRTTEATLSVIDRLDRFGHPDRVVANSRASARYLESVYGRSVPDVVYPGVTVADFVPLAAPADAVIAVGSWGANKRLRLVLEAVREVDGLTLYLAGNGWPKDRLTAMADALGIGARTFFLEGLSNRNVQVLLTRCLAVLFTPLREPFGIVALEALAAGRPLLAVEGGGYSEVVDESCAFLLPPEPAAFAERLTFLRDHPDVAARMGQAGRARAAAYSWDRTATELLEIIVDVARQSRAPVQLAAAPAVESLVGVHYCCGYGDGLSAGQWQLLPHRHGVTDMPALGYYASHQGTIIAEHLRTLAATGIDFAILNLSLDDAPDGYELIAAEHIFSVAEQTRSPLRFAVQVSVSLCPTDTIHHLLDTVRHAFTRRSAYLHLAGQPVLLVNWSPQLDCAPAQRQHLLDASAGFLRIARSPWVVPHNILERLLPHFDGWCLKTPLLCGPADTWEARWRQAYDCSGPVRAVTLCPGYDDRHLPAAAQVCNGPRMTPREDGRVLQRMADFAMALDPKPDLVLIDSFNDYHVNTHVECSKAHGGLYLDLVRRLIERMQQRRCVPAPPRAA